jgi:SNF2 family DNA or RNA helicase
MSYTLVDGALEQRLTDKDERERWLLLEDHPDFKGHWRVNGFGKDWKYDLDEVMGHYRAISPGGFTDFQEAASEAGYNLAFFDDPESVLDAYTSLNDLPEVAVNSTLPGTTNGMLPYQVQGFNFLKNLDGGVARWDTGTGKTVVASALVKYHQESFDYGFFVVKKNNKVNTVRKLLASVGVEAVLVDGMKTKRQKAYDLAEATRPGVVLVMNYETFKNDFVWFERKIDRNGKEYVIPHLTDWGEVFFEDTDVLCIWDEMPMKLKNRSSLLYKAICTCLYQTQAPQVDWEKRRPRNLRQYMLSATPVENDPEDWFNCVRLLDPRIYGTVREFRDEYVASYSYFDPTTPESWHMLDKMALKAVHIVHQVDKDDPEIAAVFPKVVEESLYIDWNDEAARLYRTLDKLAKDLAKDEEAESLHVLSLINLYQMICDAPTMILDTAAKREIYESALEAWESMEGDWATRPEASGSGAALSFLKAITDGTTPFHKITNKNHAKLEALRGLLEEVHPDEKVCIFTRWNAAIMPTLMALLDEWEVPYVRYGGSNVEKQTAQDAFQNDPNVRVFLSSDAGSDSIDLDAGNVVIHYDLPWKWTTFIQRQNRVHRATSKFATVYYYTLLMANSVEDRILQIIMQKQGYHNGLFQPIAGVSTSARITRDDFLYILTGSRL